MISYDFGQRADSKGVAAVSPEFQQRDPAEAGGTDIAESLVDALFEANHAGMAVLDRDLRFVRVNERFARLTAVSAEEHLGRTPMETIPELPPERYVEALQHALDGASLAGLRVEGVIGEHDAFSAWDVSLLPLRSPGGGVAGVGVVAVDVTVQVRAEQALREREATLRVIVESAPSALLIVDGTGVVVAANAEA